MAPSKTTNQINHDESKEKQTLLFMAGNPPKRFKPDAISRELRELLESSGSSKKFSYGTAGFRDDADLLVGVMTRVGMIAALRSIGLRNSNIGVMITASHNAEKDNGAKIVDDDGGMLAVNWEPLAEDLVNAPTADEAIATIERIQQSFSTDGNLLSTVLIARDTRPHSAKLAECVRRGAEAMGAKTFDLGEMTTPQLHFIVMYLNEAETYSNEANFDPYSVLSIYNQTLAGGYISLLATAAGDNRHTVIVDGSNGIGATQLPPLDAEIDRLHPGILTVDLRNRAGDGPVNEGCGAELVQKSQIPPASVSAAQDEGIPIASFDGDADRIVFHTFRTDGNWSLVDGDKIAALISTFILQEFTACDWIDKWKVGIVQTAYANGASTEFLARQGMEVVFAKTGVKYLHAKAHEFDCGVYFEANGHGTVLFSGALRTAIDVAFASLGTADDRHALAIRRIHVSVPCALRPVSLCDHMLLSGLYENHQSRSRRCNEWTAARSRHTEGAWDDF